MYAEPGSIYVYLSYGIHLAGNVVCSPVGEASAVLLRAGEVVTGVELARLRRWGAASDGQSRSDAELARGPGNLGKALGLSLSDNGELLGGGLFDFEPPERPADRVEISTRVGIAKNPDALLRFWLRGEPSVSAYRRPLAG
jgi:DNA-3-methyladenine glycosylase